MPLHARPTLHMCCQKRPSSRHSPRERGAFIDAISISHRCTQTSTRNQLLRALDASLRERTSQAYTQEQSLGLRLWRTLQNPQATQHTWTLPDGKEINDRHAFSTCTKRTTRIPHRLFCAQCSRGTNGSFRAWISWAYANEQGRHTQPAATT